MKFRNLLRLLPFVFTVSFHSGALAAGVFAQQQFTHDDAVLVVSTDNRQLYSWQANQPKIPASLIKLVTMSATMEKWNLGHRFKTEFYQRGNEVWIKGYGDPFLISEELQQVANALKSYLPAEISVLHVDDSYFPPIHIAGRSDSDDPYNAPLSALAANFNTVKLNRTPEAITSGEPQTPLTAVAKSVAQNLGYGRQRVQLKNRANGARHCAQILLHFVGATDVRIKVNSPVAANARLIYTHYNSRDLEKNLAAMMRYSNNFIANQLFVKLSEKANRSPLDLETAKNEINQHLSALLNKPELNKPELNKPQSPKQKLHKSKVHKLKVHEPKPQINEGAGLDRSNRLSANHILYLLRNLSEHKHLFNYEEFDGAKAWLKTGTLDGVSNLAGYYQVGRQSGYFVFLFNRKVSADYRFSLLRQMLADLQQAEIDG